MRNREELRGIDWNREEVRKTREDGEEGRGNDKDVGRG